MFNTIEKKEFIDYDEFIEQHVKTRIPVVFKNASKTWSDNTLFTPDFFKNHFGNIETWSEGVKYSMNEILEITANSSPEKPGPYPIQFEIPEQLPKLLEMLQPIHMGYAQPNWFRSKIFPYGKFGNNIHLFIGGPGNQYSLHQDLFHTNAWITQLYGEKKFILFPGDQSEYLYGQGSGNALSPVNILKPDLSKYPKYQYSKSLEIILQPGETIYIPNGVWHTTLAYEHNISLIFDQLNRYNFKSWSKDMYSYKKNASPLKASASYLYALTAGLCCRIAEIIGIKF